jgi:hypothetical protein
VAEVAESDFAAVSSAQADKPPQKTPIRKTKITLVLILCSFLAVNIVLPESLSRRPRSTPEPSGKAERLAKPPIEGEQAWFDFKFSYSRDVLCGRTEGDPPRFAIIHIERPERKKSLVLSNSPRAGFRINSVSIPSVSHRRRRVREPLFSTKGSKHRSGRPAQRLLTLSRVIMSPCGSDGFAFCALWDHL